MNSRLEIKSYWSQPCQSSSTDREHAAICVEGGSWKDVFLFTYLRKASTAAKEILGSIASTSLRSVVAVVRETNIIRILAHVNAIAFKCNWLHPGSSPCNLPPCSRLPLPCVSSPCHCTYLCCSCGRPSIQPKDSAAYSKWMTRCTPWTAIYHFIVEL